jgi:hypothetical protein
MASFKERYEELFGPTPDYDPIEIGRIGDSARRRALDIEAAVPSPTGDMTRQALPEPPSIPEEPVGALRGLLTTGASKTVAEPLLGAVEYGARQAGFDSGVAAIEDARAGLADWRESVYARMSPEVMDMVGRELTTLDPDKTIWRGGPGEVAEAVTYKVLEQVPSLLATLVPGALMMRAGASARAIQYLGASEAGISLGAIQNDIADGITQMDTQQLRAESPRFAQLLGEMDEEAARAQLIREAQGMAPVIGGLAVGAISAAAGRYLEPVITGTGGHGFFGRVGRGALSEGLLQEGPQESVETVASNVAAAVYDGDRNALEGVVESFAQGALLGAIMGGGVAGVLGRREAPGEEPTPDAPDAPAPPDRPATFPEVFGEGGESPFIAPDESPDVPEDVRAAISANIREDNVMDDMVDNLNYAQGEQRRMGQGLPTDPTTQGELFPTAAPTTGPGVALGPPQRELEGQGELFPGPEAPRRLGSRPLRAAPAEDIGPFPEEEPVGPEGDIYEVARRTDDLFAEPAETPVPEGEIREPVARGARGRFRVRFTDDAGQTIEDRTFSDQRRAERFADEIADEYGLSQPDADARVQVTPVRPLPRQQTQPTQDEQVADITQQPEEEPLKTAGEEVADEIRTDLETPFEERVELASTVTPAKTRKEAAEKLVVKAGKQLDKERSQAIGGMFPPEAYDFNDPKNEARYRKAWGELERLQRDVDVAREMKAPNLGALASKLARKKKSTMKQLAQIRQLDKPKRKAQRKVEAAKKADVSTVRTLRKDAAKIAKLIDKTTEDAVGDLPEMTREQVDKLTPLELDIAFEQAQQYLESTDVRYERRKTAGPSVKRKYILRALNKRRNRAETESRLEGQPLATKGSPQGIKTRALTSVTQKADESKADKIKRERAAKEAYTVLDGVVKKARRRVKDLEVELDSEGDLTTEGRLTLKAKAFLQQSIQLAEAVAATGQNDKTTIDFIKSVTKLVQDATGSIKSVSNMWDRQMKLVDSWETGTHGRTAPKETKAKRVNSIIESNIELGRTLRRAERMEMLKKDKVYNTFVHPIIEKFSASYWDKGWYQPSLEEAQMLAWAMSEWRRAPGDFKKEYYDPLRRTLKYYGFEFNEGGDLVVEEKDGKFVFSPSEALLMSRAKGESPAAIGEVAFSPPPTRGMSAEDFNRYQAEQTAKRQEGFDKADLDAQKDEANRHVKATAIFQQFRKIVDNKKSTIARLIDAEEKLIQDLKREGFVRQLGSAFVTIRVPGRPDITLRRSAQDLGNRRINKTQARKRMSAIRKAYTQELVRYGEQADRSARSLRDTELMSEEFQYTYEVAEDAVTRFSPDHREAASALGDMLLDESVPTRANDVLNMLVQNLPRGSVYGTAARMLAKYNFGDVEVVFGSLDQGLGLWSPSTNKITLDKNKLAKMPDAPARAIHAVLHEIVHAGTQEAIARNPNLKELMGILRGEALRQWKQGGGMGYTPYGFRADVPVDEFVAELFTNPETQAFAKTVFVEGIGQTETLWTKFKNLVKDLLGWVRSDNATAFDVVMELEGELFQYIDERRTDRPDLMLDVPLGRVAGEVMGKMNQSFDLERRARDVLTRTGGRRVSHAFHTMRQLRERYEKYFGGSTGPLARYMDAFTGRNSRNNELMQMPEKLSRKWTELRESNPEAELEFSRIATESTIHSLDPSKGKTHERNKDSAKSQPEKFNELRQRYNALPQEYKELWTEVTKFYSASLADETNLMLLNAIRGVVTGKGKNAMDPVTFDRTYNKDNISQYTTQEKIEAEFGEYLGDKAADLIELIQSMANPPQMKQGVYFPLMRYGDFAAYAEVKKPWKYYKDSQEANAKAAELRADDPTLTVQVRRLDDGRYGVRVVEREFVTGESAAEVDKERERLVEEYGAENVFDTGRKLQIDNEASINSNAALASILSTLEGNKAAQQAIKQFYLKSLSDSSFRKREIKRQNRRGVNYDLQHRNFANYAKQSAYYRAQLEFGSKMGQAMSDMRDFLKNYRQGEQPPELQNKTRLELDSVYETLRKRDDMMTDPLEVSGVVRKGIALTQFYMLTSASYHIINSTQPWMVTAPTMAARHGWGDSLSAMKKAQKLIRAPIWEEVKGSGAGVKLLPWLKNANTNAEKAFAVFDEVVSHLKQNDARADEHIKMLEQLRKTHVLEVSPLTELREIAGGKDNKFGKVLDASRIMAHFVEVNNRVLTAISAYDLEYNKQIANGAGVTAAQEAATKYAEDMVSQTQFDYSTANKPPAFMRFPLLFQFMQWSQHIYAHMARNFYGAYKAGLMNKSEARSALLGILGTHAAVGGAIGVTLQPIKMAFGMAMLAFGDDDEPYTVKDALSGATFDRTFSGATNDLFGTTVSTALSRGIPAAVGADVSTRMSLGTLYFIDVRGDTPESILGSIGASFGGAFVNQMLTFGRGVQHIGSGDYLKAAESFSPKFLRDILRAGRFATDGLVNTSGDTVLDTGDLGFVDVALQAVGFTPTTTSQFYQAQAAIKGAEGYVRKRRIRLMKDFRTATGNERSKVIREIVEFNRAYPQEAITRSTLLRNLQSKFERESQYSRYGAAIDDKKAALYSGYGEPYRED